jgi:hypothetical protein
MNTIPEEAARLYFLLDLGLVRDADVILWADDAIVSADKPSSALIDLAVSGPENLSSTLRTVALGIDPLTAINLAMPVVLREIEKKPELARVIARKFFDVAFSEGSSLPSRYTFFKHCDEDFYLAECGIYDYVEVHKKFIEQLRVTLK